MASGSELAADKVEPTLVVGPTEDVVQALMETLVDPLLPLRVSNECPSIDAQKSVSKQMHAVVLLYNYYHRKQKPELIFLDFAHFCKLAVVLRPPLISFMKLFKESESMELNGAEDQLSLTDKAIKDACDIATALDASRDFPNIGGWPISKVAVLLMDSKKENCFLRFDAVTKGIWSLIEKELNESNNNQEISSEEKVGNKRKRDSQNASTDELLQFGYDAVKEVTGIDSSDLEVMETHVTYSSSKKNSAARFYMMQYRGSFNVKEQVPLKSLVESLQGRLAKKLEYGLWKATSVVEYHHLLPYVEFISCWLSGSRLEIDSSEKIIKKEEISNYPEIIDNKGDECHNGLLPGPSKELQEIDISEVTKNCPKDEDTSKKWNSIKVYHHKRKKKSSTQLGASVREDVNLKVDSVGSLKSCDTQCKDKKLSEDNGDVTIPCNQLVLFEAKTESIEDEQEELKNAMALFDRKRRELHSQICNTEDTLAIYEDNIARIRDGGEVGLARRCIESIISGNYDLLLESGTGLSETFLLGKSSCYDLEYICLKNNWRLPRYFIEPSNGKFVANVVVGRKDLKLTSNGGFEPNPCEARESAAAKMIAKLRNSCV